MFRGRSHNWIRDRVSGQKAYDRTSDIKVRRPTAVSEPRELGAEARHSESVQAFHRERGQNGLLTSAATSSAGNGHWGAHTARFYKCGSLSIVVQERFHAKNNRVSERPEDMHVLAKGAADMGAS